MDPTAAADDLVADGRFRLLVHYGGPPHVQCWQAVDTVTGAQVGLTVVDREGVLPRRDIDDIVWLTARLRGLRVPGLAPVLASMRADRGALVVSEWVRGATLREVSDTAPPAMGVAAAVRPLAEAVAAAHRSGIALSIDHPARLRVSTDGRVVQCFPATLPGATPRGDLLGIGGALYAMLLNRWPSPGATPEGWHPARVDAAGRVVEPAAVDARIPYLVSTAAAGLVRDGGIRSADAVVTLLDQAVEDAGLPGPPPREAAPAPPPGHYAGFGDDGPQRVQAARSKTMRAWLGVAAAIVVVLLLVVATTVNRLVGDGEPDAISTGQLGLGSPTAAPKVEAKAPAPPPVRAGDGPVVPAAVTAFSPDGRPDNPGEARLVIDGDPKSVWTTDTYHDPVPFPTFKEGLGLVLALPQPTVLKSVTVDLTSAGTVVQIRSSGSPAPGGLGETGELTPPTPLHPGHNNIPVSNDQPVSNVLVWIATLGTTDGKSRTEVSEIAVRAVPAPA